MLHSILKKTGIVIGCALLMAGSALPASAEGSVSSSGESGLREEKTADAAEKETGSPSLILLSWPENPDSVHNEVEIIQGVPEGLSSSEKADPSVVVYDNIYIYSNEVLIDPGSLPDLQTLYWRVRAVDQTGNPLSYFSLPRPVAVTMKKIDRNAPIPHKEKIRSPLLYEVYSYTGNPGSKTYEIEIDEKEPENPDSADPSRYRTASVRTPLSDWYDSEPRTGTWWWRVRGLDENGRANGIWSLPQKMSLDPGEHWKIGILGDSISHGGGRLYHTPADGTYSYESYLSFPAVNLSRSGDTTAEILKRFDSDVKPFHLKYLLIMGGINDIRSGVSPEETIHNLQEIEEKCRKNHIKPVLLTVIPINPAVIEAVYHTATAEKWEEALKEVNDFIRTQPHIDTAAPFEAMGPLPEQMALDGLHGDWNAKEMIAAVINRDIGQWIPEKDLQ